MQRAPAAFTFIGTLALMMGLSSSFLVASGSSDHWGYLIAIQDGQAEVVLPPANGIPANHPAMTPAPTEKIASTAGGDEITVPVDIKTALPEVGTPFPASIGTSQPSLRAGALYVPEQIEIPAISLDAPIVGAKYQTVLLDDQRFLQWLPPSQFAAGWHTSSATLGIPGNTVLNGHNNIYGGVFDHLRDLKPGDRVYATSQELIFVYEITNVMILPEKYENLEKRLANAQWLQPSQDERLTLVTCWPPNNNTDRLIVVAKPINRIERQTFHSTHFGP